MFFSNPRSAGSYSFSSLSRQEDIESELLAQSDSILLHGFFPQEDADNPINCPGQPHGRSSGSCGGASGGTGSCSYTCNNGTWVQNSFTCQDQSSG